MIYGIFDAATANQELTFNAGKMGFNGTAAVAQTTGWLVSNKTVDKILDCDATTLDEVADVQGTLIDILKANGLLGA